MWDITKRLLQVATWEMLGIDVVSLIIVISKNGPKILLNHKVSCFMHFQNKIHQDFVQK